MKKTALLSALVLAMLALGATALAQGDGSKKVEIVDFGFRPGTVTVAKGTKVEFENESASAHTVTRNRGGFDSGRLAPGRQFAIRFRQPGTYRYHCTIHPQMRGKIVVQ